MCGLLSTFEVVEFVNCSSWIHSFLCLCFYWVQRDTSLAKEYQTRSTVTEKEKIIVPGIVLLLLQNPWDELCPSWGCALRKSQTSESTCDNWMDSEWNENTWKQSLHLKEETVESRWDKAGHCSTETTGFCYRDPCRDNPRALLKETSWFHCVRAPHMLQSSSDVSAMSINTQL